ncbi:MAG: FAD binding domain-containing protein [Dehalococcoidales bacterium]|nr:FAD binding domain-containing protein [Dehalococcoidales bacterium]
MKSIRKYDHIDAKTVEEAVALLRKHGKNAWVIAGGTDLIGTMRFEVLRDYPEAVINLKSISGLDYIREEDGLLRIGALTRLEDIALDANIKSRYPALCQAARQTASPHVRAMGTIGGNICQLIRCWYFRKEDNRFDCIRKGGKMCHATCGDNRYHSIFGAARVAPPPCTSKCPSGADIPSYLGKIREGRLDEAAEILLRTNPFPAITGRVCPHYCEENCNRGEYDESLSIRSIERFMGDYILNNPDSYYQAPQQETGRKVAVIGAGPAGLSAAFYLRKMGHEVTVFEELEEAGGILTFGIPAYRLPKDIVRNQVQSLEKMGVQFRLGTMVGKDITLNDIEKDYDSVFCATGAWGRPSLRLENEDKLTFGLEFLIRVNKGLRPLSAGKVLVIGGGKVAIDLAITARRLGVEDVTMACLESREKMPALPEEVEQAVKEGIKVKPSWGPYRVLLENGRVAGMELVRCTKVYDSQGKFAPEYDNCTKEIVEADEIILATGQKPVTGYAESILEIKQGLIAVDPETQSTSKMKVFAGGDAALGSGLASVTAAVAAGRRAAVSINRHLGGIYLDSNRQVDHLIRAEGDFYKKQSRVKAPELPLEYLSLESEDIQGLDADMVNIEAGRCMNCGCDGVNPSDMAAALVALDAVIVTSGREIKAEDFWAADKGLKPAVLEDDEIVTEIKVPAPRNGIKSSFIKFALRKSIDFPIVNCAAAIETENGLVKDARICLNAVYSNPYRATKAEEAIRGKALNEGNAETAGAAAVSDAIPLPYNRFKIQIARTLVKRAILDCR